MIEDIDGNRFPENHDEALVEAKNLTGLNKTEFDIFLKTISKGYSSTVCFGSPDYFCVIFEISMDMLSLCFNLDTGLMEKKVKFRYPLKDLWLDQLNLSSKPKKGSFICCRF